MTAPVNERDDWTPSKDQLALLDALGFFEFVIEEEESAA